MCPHNGGGGSSETTAFTGHHPQRQDKPQARGVYRKPTHTDQYLLFDSRHPLEHKLGVIRTLQDRADKLPTSTQDQVKEHRHLKGALKTCGYPDWTFVKAHTRSRKENNPVRTEENKRNGIVILDVSGVLEKLRRIFNKHKVPVYFKQHPPTKTGPPKRPYTTQSEEQSGVCSQMQRGMLKCLHRGNQTTTTYAHGSTQKSQHIRTGLGSLPSPQGRRTLI